jgi:hypothetical protein
VAQGLRHCTTNRKVTGSIPDGVIVIFHWHNSSCRNMALGSTQPLTEMSTRNISWGKGGRCVGLKTLLPSCADFLKTWEPEPPGALKACNGIALPLPYTFVHHRRYISLDTDRVLKQDILKKWIFSRLIVLQAQFPYLQKCKGKGKGKGKSIGSPTTVHEGPEGRGGLALLFLQL